MASVQETNIVREIMLAFSKLGLKIFRNNSAQGWAGESVALKNGDRLIKNPYPLHAGLCKGSSDLIGFKPVEITQEMIGKKVAIFTACEVKTKTGRATPEQIAFIDMVNKNGGIGMIVRSEEEALNFINTKNY